MVIFPISEEERRPHETVPMWTAIEERQKQNAADYWLVTQPSHAALAGDLAASLRDGLFGHIDATVARCIALHDAGWSMDDAEQIQRLRSSNNQKPSGFLDATIDQFLYAWTVSIDTAGKFAPVGAYLVSRHFERLSNQVRKKDQHKLEAFRKREKERQQKARKNIDLEESALEKLVDALQFCDVLSLYLCCGSSRTVVIDNPKLSVTRHRDEYRLEPSPFRDRSQFSFAALKHPMKGANKERSGATFYLNL